MRKGIMILMLLLFSCPLRAAVVVEVEVASTNAKIEWGLMGRRELAEGKGMLFVFSRPQHTQCFWSFNCWLDLDVAVAGSDGVIREIKQLKAHPEMMDPDRPVRSLADMNLYPPGDPVRSFFLSQSVCLKGPVTYVLEVPAGWLAKQNVTPGYVLEWQPGSSQVSLAKR